MSRSLNLLIIIFSILNVFLIVLKIINIFLDFEIDILLLEVSDDFFFDLLQDFEKQDYPTFRLCYYDKSKNIFIYEIKKYFP